MPTLKRVSKGRSKLGCATCRKRRVKCGEERPECSNCVRKGFRCDGARSTVFVAPSQDSPSSEGSSRSATSTAPSTPCVKELALRPSRSPREMRAFYFWTETSCPGLAHVTDMNFFMRLLPRVAMADDATWYALIAASTLMEHPMKKSRRRNPMDDDLALGWRRQALEWYNCSIRAAKEQPTSTSTTLRTFLYGALEMLQDRPDLGLQLIHRTLMLNEPSTATTDDDYEILNATLPMLTRALVPLSMFGLMVTPEQRARTRRPSLLTQSTSPESLMFNHMEDLHNLIYDIQIFCNTLHPNRHPTPPTSDALSAQALLLTQMTDLHTALLSPNLTFTTSSPRRFLAQLLVLQHTYATKLATHFTSHDLCSYDAHEAAFTTVVAEAARVLSVVELNNNLFAWEIAAVPCLYYTAWACRRPSVRRRAIELLRERGPRQENLWTAATALGRMEALVCVEEGKREYVVEVAAEEDAVLPPRERRLPMSVAGDPLGGVEGVTVGKWGAWRREGYDPGELLAAAAMKGEEEEKGGEVVGLRGKSIPEEMAWDGENKFWNVARLMTMEVDGWAVGGESMEMAAC
jgi:hypothetical protein